MERGLRLMMVLRYGALLLVFGTLTVWFGVLNSLMVLVLMRLVLIRLAMSMVLLWRRRIIRVCFWGRFTLRRIGVCRFTRRLNRLLTSGLGWLLNIWSVRLMCRRWLFLVGLLICRRWRRFLVRIMLCILSMFLLFVGRAPNRPRDGILIVVMIRLGRVLRVV